MLSVILPNYQHLNVTKVHIREIMNSTVIPDEVIVVNDGGDPSLRETIRKMELKTKVIYADILPPKIPWNYNGAVNLGVWLSRGDFLGVEDNDNIPTTTYYEEVLKFFEDYPKTQRVVANQRFEIASSEIEKPQSEWKMTGKRGPNQGSYIMRRSLYTKLKGQDERMCGEYGWMYYDWRARMIRKAHAEFGQAGYFWYVTDGQTDLERNHSARNYRVYHSNSRRPEFHSEHGILNFCFDVEEL